MNDSTYEEELQMLEFDEINSEFLSHPEYETSLNSDVEICSKEPRKDGSRSPLSGEAAQSIIPSADRERLLAKQALIALTFRAPFRSQQKNHDLWVDRFETFRTAILQSRFSPNCKRESAIYLRHPGIFKDVDQVNIICQPRGLLSREWNALSRTANSNLKPLFSQKERSQHSLSNAAIFGLLGMMKSAFDTKWYEFSFDIVEDKERLCTTIKLRNCKGTGGVPKTQKPIEVGQVHESKFNACRPISLLIIWALRIGAVKETSWEKLLSTMRKGPSNAFVWSRPDMPVFCSKAPDATLKLKTPASSATSKSIPRTAAQTAGLLAIPNTHDIRALGHTSNSLQNGVRDLYIVFSVVDTWNMRLALKHPLPGDTHALAYCDESFKRERVLADGVDELSEEFGLNPTEKGKKNIEILHHKDRLYQEWVNTKA
ncbi:hypothetical protein V2G26_000645 [Clonostachys chloroleuca]